ncbi:cation efflux family protein [Microdochium trichocladiopsis]|uniref:Cation efflux family protein n=1 Tax=Microdochium trichocladiopsis TaxID=1682393 RepID=A0A9P8XSI3_9PEZI|nr:cation efflux family protein [Microdochium trichocladiopsis]KAH7016078.1 cation efflux family protein [Microdochium trichocladiopsis]
MREVHHKGVGVEDDEDANGTARLLIRQSNESPRRLTAEERRLSQMILSTQMRSMRLIGNSNPRYHWDRYWKTQEQLKSMPKPVRQYYERSNDLIRMYLYIDQLLESSVPHDLLNEYCESLNASAFRPIDVPHTISEGLPTPLDASPNSPSQLASLAAPESELNSTSAVSFANDTSKKKLPKRNPREIFRSTETTPLLSAVNRDQVIHDEEDSLLDGDYPKPEIPWLQDSDLDSDDHVVTLAIWVNFITNAVLLLSKIVVVLSVPSISVLASVVDAALDFLSTAIVWTTTRLIAASQNDRHRYPVGRRCLEPVGVLVFSIVMVTSFCQVFLEAIQRLASPDHFIVELGFPALTIMIGTVVIKGACWLWCRIIKNSSVRALADDAVTDVIFNAGSIFFPIVGFYAKIWWMDALGGLLLSLIVMANWSQTSMHYQIQNLRAYHVGDKLFVELDIVLSANMPLKDSHDLGEVITYFLEAVPVVDRAFVHVDYATYNLQTHINT